MKTPIVLMVVGIPGISFKKTYVDILRRRYPESYFHMTQDMISVFMKHLRSHNLYVSMLYLTTHFFSVSVSQPSPETREDLTTIGSMHCCNTSKRRCLVNNLKEEKDDDIIIFGIDTIM